MAGLFVIDIPDENAAAAAGQEKRGAIEVDDDDDAMMLRDLDVKDKLIEGEEDEPETLPLPEPRMFPHPTTCAVRDPSLDPLHSENDPTRLLVFFLLGYRSYFETDENNPSGEYKPVEEYATSLTEIPFSIYWTILTPSRVKCTHYDVVLGVSTKNLHLDTVEAIIITVQRSPSRSTPAKSEVITPQELARLCLIAPEKNGDLFFRWKLHEKLVLFTTEAQSITFAVEVMTWQDQPSDYGSIEIHYADILTDSREYYKGDTMYREHRPFLSSVDVNRTGYPHLDLDLEEPKTIASHAMSGDGSHIVITVLAGEYRLLQLWKFEEPQPVNSQHFNQESNNPRQSHNSAGSSLNDNVQSRLVAWMQLPIVNVFYYEFCLSWDATQFVYVDLARLRGRSGMKEGVTNNTSLYKVDARHSQVPEGAIAGSGFKKFGVEEQCPGLDGFLGKAAFHIISTQGQNVMDELFVTYNCVTIEIYSVVGDWTHLQSIPVGPYQSIYMLLTSFGDDLTKSLRGPYLVLKDSVPDELDRFNRFATWDIEQGTRLSSCTQRIFGDAVQAAACSAMSKDGKLIAVVAENHVGIFWTATWTLAASCTFDDTQPTPCIRKVHFIRNDTQIMVSLEYQDQFFYQNNRGMVFNVSNMSLVEEYITAGCDTFRMTFANSAKPQALCVGISQLSLFNLQDLTVQSPSKLQERCDESCSSISSFKGQLYVEATAPSGMCFKVEKTLAPVFVYGRSKNLPSVILTVSGKDGQFIQRISIRLPNVSDRYSVTFVGECSYLVMSFGNFVMVWNTPTSPQETFSLQLVLGAESVKDWNACPHQQLYEYEPISKTICEARSLADPVPSGSGDKREFMWGFDYLMAMFKDADDFMREEIIRYFAKHVNLCRPGMISDGNILHYFMSHWKKESSLERGHIVALRAKISHNSVIQLWKAILSRPAGRWIPSHNMNRGNNPILTLLNKTDKHPEVFELAKILMDYCIRQAKSEKDPHFLLPIQQCLQELTDPKKPYSEVTLELFRELAYLPARGRKYILDRHSIAHPYEIRLQFWKSNPKGLHQHQSQVLNLTVPRAVHPPKNNFTRDFYLATFDMLWIKTDSDSARTEDLARSEGSKSVFSWPIALKSVILHALWVNHNPRIQCHPFETGTLDNPAIAALVEYKWNTIGLQYWLIRFLAQCVYYVLVLIGVFMQIYHYEHESAVNGTFIAIVVFSSVFLWLEIAQMIKEKGGYIESVYNPVDLLAFMFPLAGSIQHIVWSDPSAQNTLLSFSILFIFLHFLFELRVIRGVCKFVSIIIYIISSIRVFFFIFAGGIFAFSVAIIHVLHTCINAETCPSFTDGFSLNIFRALSMTYFLMGGRYDQVSNGFSNNDVGFHIMMAVFFFFTVIIMLNVLIALINHAFDDGYRTWELEWLQNRMRYVERAENLTYDIPGYRAAHDYFPETIFYTATPQEVREYRKNTQRILEEKSAIVDAPTPAIAETKMQVPVSGGDGGGGGSSGGENVQQHPEITRADSGAEEGKDEGALMAMLKQFQEEQKLTRAEQQQTREEQQRAFEELRLAHEEQRQTAAELRKEVALLKEQLEANREIV
ncbi:hypothetical protein K457DRAFT_124668 [Linnemannia elongata AG-77]|uniref:Ion transport domain-containing protein n=1 Tax=Linnemannia elongata AG-77 TaxID=1314771 RepID=A0A197K0F5_9FUNG|nr:hypothetical protein K457DRAFT_124668 [Linnemannia elongata AG-77]